MGLRDYSHTYTICLINLLPFSHHTTTRILPLPQTTPTVIVSPLMLGNARCQCATARSAKANGWHIDFLIPPLTTNTCRDWIIHLCAPAPPLLPSSVSRSPCNISTWCFIHRGTVTNTRKRLVCGVRTFAIVTVPMWPRLTVSVTTNMHVRSYSLFVRTCFSCVLGTRRAMSRLWGCIQVVGLFQIFQVFGTRNKWFFEENHWQWRVCLIQTWIKLPAFPTQLLVWAKGKTFGSWYYFWQLVLVAGLEKLVLLKIWRLPFSENAGAEGL